VFKRTAIALFIGIVTVLATAAPAQAQATGLTLRGAFSLINFGEDFTTKGFNVDVAKEMTTSGDMGVDVVGEFGFNKVDDFNFVNIGGGARVRVPVGTQLTVLGQGVLGLVHDNSGFDANNLYSAIGGAAHFDVNPNTSVFVQLDLFTVYFDGGTDSGPRVLLGVALRR
jgi:hypothetical protein